MLPKKPSSLRNARQMFFFLFLNRFWQSFISRRLLNFSFKRKNQKKCNTTHAKRYFESLSDLTLVTFRMLLTCININVRCAEISWFQMFCLHCSPGWLTWMISLCLCIVTLPDYECAQKARRQQLVSSQINTTITPVTYSDCLTNNSSSFALNRPSSVFKIKTT